MRFLTISFKVLLFGLLLNLTACKIQYPELEDGIYAEFITNKGVMVAKLESDKVPVTVANFVSLAEGKNPLVSDNYKEKKYYNGTTFHRVMDQFMIQGGDPTATGTGNPGYKFNDEFHPDLKHDKPGVLSMANSGPNSNGSQFFITEVPKPHLDNMHSVFGQLVIGINIQDSISNVEVDKKNKPIKEVIITELNIIRKGKNAKNFDASNIFTNHFKEVERIEKEKAEKAEALIKASKEKLTKQEAQATILESGLKYYISEKGSGNKLKEGNRISIHYTVYFENGQLLETSKLETARALNAINTTRLEGDRYQPIDVEIMPNAPIIAGLKEGLKQLSLGDKATFFIPYHLAYGEYGNRAIPGKSNLIFEVQIVALLE